MSKKQAIILFVSAIVGFFMCIFNAQNIMQCLVAGGLLLSIMIIIQIGCTRYSELPRG